MDDIFCTIHGFSNLVAKVYSKVMFCRVCGFRIWVWSLTELPEVSGTGMEVLKNSQKFRVLWHGRTELTELPGRYKKCCTRTPGIVARGVQNLLKFRVRV